MKHTIAEGFSISFHPLLIPFYSLLFMMVMPIFEIKALGSSFQLYLLVMIALTTILLPLFSLYFMKKQQLISSYTINDRRERNLPYISVMMYHGLSAYLLFKISIIPIIIPFTLGVASGSALLLLLFNWRIKVSAHAAGMGSLIGLLVLIQHFYHVPLKVSIAVAIVLTALILWSRWFLKAHRLAELVLGLAIGLSVCLVGGFVFLQRYFV
jgi:hypothetical protein